MIGLTTSIRRLISRSASSARRLFQLIGRMICAFGGPFSTAILPHLGCIRIIHGTGHGVCSSPRASLSEIEAIRRAMEPVEKAGGRERQQEGRPAAVRATAAWWKSRTKLTERRPATASAPSPVSPAERSRRSPRWLRRRSRSTRQLPAIRAARTKKGRPLRSGPLWAVRLACRLGALRGAMAYIPAIVRISKTKTARLAPGGSTDKAGQDAGLIGASSSAARNMSGLFLISAAASPSPTSTPHRRRRTSEALSGLGAGREGVGRGRKGTMVAVSGGGVRRRVVMLMPPCQGSPAPQPFPLPCPPSRTHRL